MVTATSCTAPTSADCIGGRAYFTRLGSTLRILAKIVRDELAGRALSEDEKRFLALAASSALRFTRRASCPP